MALEEEGEMGQPILEGGMEQEHWGIVDQKALGIRIGALAHVIVGQQLDFEAWQGVEGEVGGELVAEVLENIARDVIVGLLAHGAEGIAYGCPLEALVAKIGTLEIEAKGADLGMVHAVPH